MKLRERDDLPAAIYVTNRSKPRLESMKSVHNQINPGIRVEYVHAPSPEDNDRVVNRLRPGSMVINATGLGKDAPGSPLTDAVVFPEDGLVWEFNYRGNLIFLDQAEAQKRARNLQIEDGWVYFLHGWTRVIEEVFDIGIPVSGPEFERLSEIASGTRS
jgi:shikimate 5-dehydrogenase